MSDMSGAGRKILRLVHKPPRQAARYAAHVGGDSRLGDWSRVRGLVRPTRDVHLPEVDFTDRKGDRLLLDKMEEMFGFEVQ